MKQDWNQPTQPTHADLAARIIRLSTQMEEREKQDETARRLLVQQFADIKDEVTRLGDHVSNQMDVLSGRVGALEVTANRGRSVLGVFLWLGGATTGIAVFALTVVHLVKEITHWGGK